MQSAQTRSVRDFVSRASRTKKMLARRTLGVGFVKPR